MPVSMISTANGTMQKGTFPRDRSALADLGESVLDAVFNHAANAEWGEWLKTPYKLAAECGNVPLCTALMKAGATGSHLNPAIRGDHPKLVDTLLELGASPSATDEHGDAPLHVAAALGRSKIVEALLKTRSVNLNEEDSKGRTPLHLASMDGDARTVRALMLFNADVSPRLGKTRIGFTAFDLAARAGHIEAKKALCGHDTAGRAVLTDGATLHEAAEQNNVAMIDLLVESGTEVDSSNDDGRTALHTAAFANKAEAMVALMKHGADTSALDAEGLSPLHLAAGADSVSAVDVLCAAGVDLDLRAFVVQSMPEDDCWSALDFAAAEGNLDALKALVRHGANVMANSSSGLTVMNTAAARNKTEVIDALVALGPSVNGEYEDDTSITPLHTAVRANSCDAIRSLAQHEANLNKLDHSSETPLQLAVRFERVDAAEALLASGVNVNLRVNGETPLETLFEEEPSKDVLKVLLKAGAIVNIPDENGMYPIQQAAKYVEDAEEMIDLLVEAGADVNAGSGLHRSTPLHIACSKRNGSAVAALLRHGAATDVVDVDGNTPLHSAAVADGSHLFKPAEFSWIGHKFVPSVDLLLRAGADETAVDGDGNTPHDRVRLKFADGRRLGRSSSLVLQLLERAAVDRAWRRRALWAMCRAYPAMVQLEHIANPSKIIKVTEGDIAAANGGGEEVGAPQDGTSAEEFSAIAERVLGLHEEGVFRSIISFV